jgi:dual-specificity kinase
MVESQDGHFSISRTATASVPASASLGAGTRSPPPAGTAAKKHAPHPHHHGGAGSSGHQRAPGPGRPASPPERGPSPAPSPVGTRAPVHMARALRESISSRELSFDPAERNADCDEEDGHYAVRAGTLFAARYRVLRLLGQGTFGKVVQALDLHTNEQVAIKIIKSIQKYRDAAKVEIQILRALARGDPEGRKWVGSSSFASRSAHPFPLSSHTRIYSHAT